MVKGAFDAGQRGHARGRGANARSTMISGLISLRPATFPSAIVPGTGKKRVCVGASLPPRRGRNFSVNTGVPVLVVVKRF